MVKDNVIPKNTAPAAVTGPAARGFARSQLVIAALTLLVLLVVAGVWFVLQSFTRPVAETPDRAELVALETQLERIQADIQPIATALASATATGAGGAIDVGAYRERVAALRDVVDSTNDLSATTTAALEIRDLVLTGGSQVVAGMNQALDALASDEASATTQAAVRVEDGIANLEDAHAKLLALLGTTQRS
jgi:hypothetical protein